MVKKSAKKKSAKKSAGKKPVSHRKKTDMKKIPSSKSEMKTEKMLIENFVSLQKVMVNLSIKFDNLASKISKLLELFEISAKALAEKDFDSEKKSKDTGKILEKIDTLGEQNKIIAKGLILMNDKLSEEPSHPKMQMPPQKMPQKQSPLPGKNVIPVQQSAADMAGYQKSISSTKPAKEFKKLPRQNEPQSNL